LDDPGIILIRIKNKELGIKDSEEWTVDSKKKPGIHIFVINSIFVKKFKVIIFYHIKIDFSSNIW